jgi:RNA polymerase sigma factor (sigma-70 family)
MSSIQVLTPDILHSHEEAFCKYYQWLVRWALQFTGNDREKADELVQEVFAQLIFSHTDLSAVQNIAGYLYTTLHNTHVSQVRIAARSHTQSLSIVDYNLADTALHSSDPSLHYQIVDELRRVCQYACVRKQSSRAGSVLILRFFYSYHISEIAKVVGCTSQAVRQCLRLARNEARLFLDNPAALGFIQQSQLKNVTSCSITRNAEELLSDLRRAVFSSRQGDCLSVKSLQSLYQANSNLRPGNSVVSHFVSCRRCLDAINRRLSIPLLAERFGEDNNDADDSSRPNTTGGRKQSGNGSHTLREASAPGVNRSLVLRVRRNARELFEYYPRELRVSVNGHLLGSHFVNSELSKLRLDITLSEPISFLEVMTEENTRLLMMSVAPPPNGDPRQMRHVELSDDRSLEATLQYGHPWPMLEVVYHNPNFEAESHVQIPELEEFSNCSRNNSDVSSPDGASEPVAADCDTPTRQPGLTGRVSVSSKTKRLGRWLAAWATIFKDGFAHVNRPAVTTAIVSVILIAALLFVWLNPTSTPSNSAAALLARAGLAESATAARPSEVVHRVITLEERSHPSGALISKRQIDLWKDVSGKSSRRVYDEKSQLVAAEWIRNTERQQNHARQPLTSRMIYQKGQKPRFESSDSSVHVAISNLDIWRLEPSVNDFRELIANPELAEVKETPGFFVITYTAPKDERDNILLAATLKLNKSDLHANEFTLVVRRNGEARAYHLGETNFERRPVSATTPTLFEPDAELFGTGGATGRHEKGPNHPSAQPPVVSFSAVASSELEVEVAFLLDRFRTRFGDQISLSRTAKGTLFVQAIVDTDEAKAEVIQALAPVANNPAVNIEVNTAIEVLQRQQRNRFNEPVVRQFSGSDEKMPAYEELHRYFSLHANRAVSVQSTLDDSTDSTDRAIRAFAAQAVGRSRRVLSHTIELKQLKNRVTAGTLDALTSDARNKWFGMIRSHAEIIRVETGLLMDQLDPIFFVSKSIEKQTPETIGSDEELANAIDRVYKLVIANDETIRSIFTASSGRSETAALKDLRFRVALVAIQNLSDGIQRAASTRQ